MIKANTEVVILITASSADEANMLAEKLVELKLAACVNTTKVNSLFHWQGKIDKAEETLLIVKSKSELLEELETIVKKYHSYEVPEIIALPIVAASNNYLKWINNSVK
ncbi:MAG: divalent-cation tolerance protein CutA [Candidatus Omnitrophota bacterium]